MRSYQPYFVDDLRYIADVALHTSGYIDTHHYDAIGSETRVDTASGYQRRQTYTSWFTIHEDESDTATEVHNSQIDKEGADR